jgi:hypothetical protein
MLFTKSSIEKRIKEIEMALEQSAGQHNALLGRLQELQYLMSVGVPINQIDEANESIEPESE